MLTNIPIMAQNLLTFSRRLPGMDSTSNIFAHHITPLNTTYVYLQLVGMQTVKAVIIKKAYLQLYSIRKTGNMQRHAKDETHCHTPVVLQAITCIPFSLLYPTFSISLCYILHSLSPFTVCYILYSLHSLFAT